VRLSVDSEPVDVLLRDFDAVETFWDEARNGRFEIDNVEGHIGGLPTYPRSMRSRCRRSLSASCHR
jgi:hypothetical protein